ncbi:Protein of unknown function [Bacillus mycoides]|nr:Protein of unknown function [Bacillus mycoides]
MNQFKADYSQPSPNHRII